MKKRLSGFLIIFALLLFSNTKAYSHCEVPCGIYTDHLRIELIKEHITTIDKAMKEIERLSAEEEVNYNQIVRWVNTKEHHANLIQDIAEQYFMTQRVKPVDHSDEEAYHKYIEELSLLHEILIYSMKAKQTTDIAITGVLLEKTTAFEKVYFGMKDHDHDHDHAH